MSLLQSPVALLAGVACLALAAGCAPLPVAPPTGLLDVTSRPAERALLAGMTAYDNGQYDEAEGQLRLALSGDRLVSPRDVAAANKYLAFILCTSHRLQECGAAFTAARKADPAFALPRSESGHPAWGPVYSRVLP